MGHLEAEKGWDRRLKEGDQEGDLVEGREEVARLMVEDLDRWEERESQVQRGEDCRRVEEEERVVEGRMACKDRRRLEEKGGRVHRRYLGEIMKV